MCGAFFVFEADAGAYQTLVTGFPGMINVCGSGTKTAAIAIPQTGFGVVAARTSRAI
jgi:hypothetical protein